MALFLIGAGRCGALPRPLSRAALVIAIPLLASRRSR